MSALALKAYGTSIADDLASDKEAYNGEKMVAIYQKMKDMIDAGYWGDGILSTDFNTERNMFEAGKAAFTVDGTWNCGNFQNDSDTTLFDAQKIGVTRIPYIDEANKTVEMGGGSDTYYITIKKRLQIPEMGICILHDWSNGSGSLYTDPDQQHCNSIKCKEQPVLPDPDLCCVWYVPGDIPLYRIHGWNLQEPG